MTNQIRYMPAGNEFEAQIFLLNKAFSDYAAYHGKVVKVSIIIPPTVAVHPEFKWFTRHLQSTYQLLEFSWNSYYTVEINKAHKYVISGYRLCYDELERTYGSNHEKIQEVREEGREASAKQLKEILAITNSTEVL